jgi:hypothetical protein
MVAKIVLLVILIVSPLTATPMNNELIQYPFSGRLPVMKEGSQYVDSFQSYSPLLQRVYEAHNQPYSPEWIDTFLSPGSKKALILLHQNDLQEMLNKKMVGVVLYPSDRFAKVRIDLLNDEEEIETIMTIWEKNGEGAYVIVALD